MFAYGETRPFAFCETEMVDEILRYLEQHQDGPIGYVVLALASAIEYLVPPFPGDTIALFGVFLAATAGYNPVLVHLTLTSAATLGGLASYGFGRAIGEREERWPRFMRGQRTKRALETVRRRFKKHGAIYLALNRFVPVLRGVFFIGAGMAELPVAKVALYGAASAAVWNAILLALGYAVGESFDQLRGYVERYTSIVLIAVFLLALLAMIVGLVRKRSAA